MTSLFGWEEANYTDRKVAKDVFGPGRQTGTEHFALQDRAL